MADSSRFAIYFSHSWRPGDVDLNLQVWDARLRCSPYSLFEIRLAERADIPRLILYERTTGFRPPRTILGL